MLTQSSWKRWGHLWQHHLHHTPQLNNDPLINYKTSLINYPESLPLSLCFGSFKAYFEQFLVVSARVFFLTKILKNVLTYSILIKELVRWGFIVFCLFCFVFCFILVWVLGGDWGDFGVFFGVWRFLWFLCFLNNLFFISGQITPPQCCLFFISLLKYLSLQSCSNVQLWQTLLKWKPKHLTELGANLGSDSLSACGHSLWKDQNGSRDENLDSFFIVTHKVKYTLTDFPRHRRTWWSQHERSYSQTHSIWCSHWIRIPKTQYFAISGTPASYTHWGFRAINPRAGRRISTGSKTLEISSFRGTLKYIKQLQENLKHPEYDVTPDLISGLTTQSPCYTW